MSEDPEFLNLAAFGSACGALLKRFRDRMSPEVKQALFVIVDAIFEDPIVPPPAGPRRDPEDLTARSKRWAEEGAEHIRRSKERVKTVVDLARKQREHIDRAERGVKTRRKNAKKKQKVGGTHPHSLDEQRPAERRTKKRRCNARYIRKGDRARTVRAYCALDRDHNSDHQSERIYPSFIWPAIRRPRGPIEVTLPRPKKAWRQCRFKSAQGDRCLLASGHPPPTHDAGQYQFVQENWRWDPDAVVDLPPPKKSRCRSTNVSGDRCALHGCHSGDHQAANASTWHPAQRVKKRSKRLVKKKPQCESCSPMGRHCTRPPGHTRLHRDNRGHAWTSPRATPAPPQPKPKSPPRKTKSK